jgi:hypothetical protein
MPTSASIQRLQDHPLSSNGISQHIAPLGIYKLDGIKEGFSSFLMHFLPILASIFRSVNDRWLSRRCHDGSLRIKGMDGSKIYGIQACHSTRLPACSPILGL